MAESYVTLVLNDQYVIGALVLGHSLRKANTTKPLTCLIGPDVTHERRMQLLDIYDELVDVETADSGDAARLGLLKRPELGITFTKIQAWKLTHYRKCVFLDADTLVLKNVDDLFERPAFAAAPDIGWPDCFNSGVFVFEPSDSTYKELSAMAKEHGSFDGGDQGLLNQYFSNWRTSDSAHRLPFTDNTTANAAYGYAPAFEQFRQQIRIVHFIGAQKPWMGPAPQGTHGLQALHDMWWSMHDDLVKTDCQTVPYRIKMGLTPSGHSVHEYLVPQNAGTKATEYLGSRSAEEITERIRRLSSARSSRGSPRKFSGYGYAVPLDADDDDADDDADDSGAGDAGRSNKDKQ